MQPTGPGNRRRFVPLIVLGSVLILGIAYALRGGLFPTTGADTPQCGFLLITGAPCPGCGMTRAAGLLLRGEPSTASLYHPLVIPLAAAAVVALVLASMEAITGRPHFRGFVDRHGVRAVLVFFAALLGVWLVRILVFPDLAPDPIPPSSPAGRAMGG